MYFILAYKAVGGSFVPSGQLRLRATERPNPSLAAVSIEQSQLSISHGGPSYYSSERGVATDCLIIPTETVLVILTEQCMFKLICAFDCQRTPT